ncbi:hypothetical protein SBRCBS47491_008625 [Sporothrix bragantina]|uniref:Cation/H+ exchanger transmembrane domain-containing protein n=1 Tax=Sporothrix bragantina TaxID=671064 RepID=A0ABP0CNL3_9PEZI
MSHTTSTAPHATAALTYEEPHIDTILVQASLLLVLNVANWALDRLLYCGPVGQILVGVAWGTPGGKILSVAAEEVAVQLGYLGLILIVFEGGLSTSLASARANWARSTGVAITGIAAPIGLSFILGPMAGATALQCFSAGAALCSTSLGTMFTVLRASGLTTTRLGVVLSTAAMLDDVVGLVMVQVIANLGGGSGSDTGDSVSAVTIVRPVLVSVAFGVVSVVACMFVLRPIRKMLAKAAWAQPGTSLGGLLQKRETALVLHTLLLVALVAGASYAGTSNLFAAYIAGAALSWWDSETPVSSSPTSTPSSPTSGTSTPVSASTPTSPIISPVRPSSPIESKDNISQAARRMTPPPEPEERRAVTRQQKATQTPVPSASTPPKETSQTLHNPCSGTAVFEHYYLPALKWVLQPLFFASIGFSIPITRMFSGPIVWRGVVYGVLMCIGKLVCGAWLLRLPSVPSVKVPKVRLPMKKNKNNKETLEGQREKKGKQTEKKTESDSPRTGTDSEMDGVTTPARAVLVGEEMDDTVEPPSATLPPAHATPDAPAPFSLYPAAILGLAMVPRGEIGFLISSVAESNGVFGGDAGPEAEGRPQSDVFLVVTWAIVLCTVFGPPAVGLLVRRVKRLSSGDPTSTRNPLGVWGL